MLETKLSPRAALLYHWIRSRPHHDGRVTLDLQDFQAWTAEYREKPYGDREVLDALREIKAHQFVKVRKTQVTLDLLADPRDREPLPNPGSIERGDRPNPVLLVFTSVLTAFAFGLFPLLFAFHLSQANPGSPLSPTPWAVLSEKTAD